MVWRDRCGSRPETRAGMRAGHRARGWRVLPLILLLALVVQGLAGFGGARTFRELGLLPGGPEETPFTLNDLMRLRNQPAPPVIGARAAIVWDATAGSELFSKAP